MSSGKKKGKLKESNGDIKVEISEKQFDDVLFSLARRLESEIEDRERSIRRLMRSYYDKERDKHYSDISLTYYAIRKRGRHDVEYEVKRAGKIGFV